MAPVAGAVANGEEDRLVLFLRPRNSFLTPRIPVNRIVGVLEEIGTGRVDQPVGIGLRCLRDRWDSEKNACDRRRDSTQRVQLKGSARLL
jgi:hypothetical protein